MIRFATSLRRWIRLGVGLLAFALVVTGCDAFIDQNLDDSNPETPSVAEIVTEVQALSTLGEGATRADLLDDLETDGITLFAPVDGAFDPIDMDALLASRNRDLLEEVLTYHVVPQELTSEDISDGMTVGTLDGDPLTLGVGDEVTVNGATVPNIDVNATNGVVHVIDGVLVEAVDAVEMGESTIRNAPLTWRTFYSTTFSTTSSLQPMSLSQKPTCPRLRDRT